MLSDGSSLKFTSGPWSGGSDPLLWGCLTASNADPSHVVVALTDNRPMGYSVQIAPGASVSRDAPTLDSTTARLLFDIASAGKARNLELLTAASTIQISVPVAGLAPSGPPVIVAAVRTNMAVVAASATQTAFLLLEGLLQVIAAPEAAALTTALDASGNIDCVAAAVTSPRPGRPEPGPGRYTTRPALPRLSPEGPRHRDSPRGPRRGSLIHRHVRRSPELGS